MVCDHSLDCMRILETVPLFFSAFVAIFAGETELLLAASENLYLLVNVMLFAHTAAHTQTKANMYLLVRIINFYVILEKISIVHQICVSKSILLFPIHTKVKLV